MKISEWLANRGSYNDGVKLYAAHPKANNNLLRVFMSRETPTNRQKLKYELKKLVNKKAPSVIVSVPVDNTVINEEPIKTQSNKKPNAFKGLHIRDLPVELHPMYIQQKADFQTACSLKMQLNALAPEQETEALKLCLSIEALFDRITTAWEVFNHYKTHKVVLDLSTPSFKDLTPVQLIQRRNSKRSSITKAEKRLQVYAKNKSQFSTHYALKQLERRVQKTKATLLKHKTELTELNKLIDG